MKFRVSCRICLRVDDAEISGEFIGVRVVDGKAYRYYKIDEIWTCPHCGESSDLCRDYVGPVVPENTQAVSDEIEWIDAVPFPEDFAWMPEHLRELAR